MGTEHVMGAELGNQLPLWIRYIAILATPTVALLVGVFAAAQWFTANQKLKSDLIERRVDVFDKIQQGMGKFFEQGYGTTESLQLFRRAALESHLLFSAELAKLVDELYDRCKRSGFVAIRLYQEGLPVGDERTRLAAEKAELVGLMEAKFGDCRAMFLAESKVKTFSIRLFG